MWFLTDLDEARRAKTAVKSDKSTTSAICDSEEVKKTESANQINISGMVVFGVIRISCLKMAAKYYAGVPDLFS